MKLEECMTTEQQANWRGVLDALARAYKLGQLDGAKKGLGEAVLQCEMGKIVCKMMGYSEPVNGIVLATLDGAIKNINSINPNDILKGE
jgi:hypothetical protein